MSTEKPDKGKDIELDDDEVQPLDIAGPGVDPLTALLDMDTVVDADDTTTDLLVPVRPSGTKLTFTIGVVDELEELRDRCMRTERVPGNRSARQRVLDQDLFYREIILAGVQNPKLDAPMLMAKHGIRNQPRMIVDKLLKPGHIVKLAEAILDHSGFDDEDLVEAGKG